MLVETFEHKGYTVKIETDDSPESPREWDNLGTMVCWHNRYNLGDEQPKVSVEDWLYDKVTYEMSYNQVDYLDRQMQSSEQSPIDLLLSKFQKDNIVLPLYLYDHSGITMKTTSFHDPWDSGQVGIIYVSKESVKQEYGWKRLTAKRLQKIKDYLEGEVSTYDAYLTGEVYGYTVEKDEEDIDSCWGFYGLDYCIEEAKSITEKDARGVTLWLNADNTVTLLGALLHGTEIVVDQKLVDDLQKLVDAQNCHD
jgi:hypothetical protein